VTWIVGINHEPSPTSPNDPITRFLDLHCLVPRRSVTEYLANFTRHRRDVACVFPEGYRTSRWTYGELLNRAKRFAAFLASAGIIKGDRIMIWGANRGEWLAAFWGALLRGVVVVPTDRTAAPEFAARVFQQVNAKLLVSSRGLTLPLATSTLHFEDFPSLPPGQIDTVESSRGDPVQIVFTSGTTGEPKGVVITHGNILANLEPIEGEIQKYLRYERIFHPLRFLNLLPLSHVFGQFMGIFIPPLMGATVTFLESIKPSDIVNSIRSERISVLVIVPRLLGSLRDLIEAEMAQRLGTFMAQEQMQKAGNEHFARRWWRFRRIHSQFGWKFWAIVSGGATLDHDDEEFWRRLGFAVIQGYGLTETTSLVSLNHPFKLGRGSIGKALPGRDIKLDDSGEILVRGDSVAKTYWVNGQSVAAREGEWFRTGDLGAIDEAGNLYFKGRKKNVIVTPEGLNVYPEDLEGVLRSNPQVRDCVVVGIERAGNAEPCAVLVLEPQIANNASEAAARAVAEANSKLGAHQRIRQWLLWPDADLPRTSTQKPRHDLIAAYATAQLSDSTNGNVPRTALEHALAALGKRGDASQLDGDLNLSSIDRIDLLTSLEQRYQVNLDESRFAEAATVADVERILREASAAPAASRHHYPDWAQSAVIRWIRVVIYYLFAWPATLIMAKPQVTGRDRLQHAEGPVLFISNHVTYIDAGCLMFAMPARYRDRLAIAMQGEMLAAMRKPPAQMNVFQRAVEVLSYWLVTALFDVFPLPQRSGFRDSFVFAGKSVDRGYSVLVFPEGQRTTSGEMSSFRSGIGILAKQLKIPVVPMRIDGLFPLKLAKRHFANPGDIKVIVGNAMQFQDEMPPEAITHALEDAVRNLHTQQ
jgi:long-chain acyl-CoA synthetase